MNKGKALDLESSEKLLDVVFGVVVGISLLELPDAFGKAITTSTIHEWNRSILLIASLIYVAFYWLEGRHFIALQNEFNKEFNKTREKSNNGIPLDLSVFLIGSLTLMALAAAQLTFSNQGNLLMFSYAAACFWFLDVFGSVNYRHEYKKYETSLNLSDSRKTDAERWYISHICTPFFYFYSLSNFAVYLTGIIAIQVLRLSPTGELCLCFFYLFVCLFRHLYVRSYLLEKVTDHYEEKMKRTDI